jgi:hypothetical protein
MMSAPLHRTWLRADIVHENLISDKVYSTIKLSNKEVRIYIFSLQLVGGPGVWFVWVVDTPETLIRLSDVAQIRVDDGCPHAVVDFAIK